MIQLTNNDWDGMIALASIIVPLALVALIVTDGGGRRPKG